MDRPFRFSIAGLLILTTGIAAGVALVAQAPAVAMILAVVAVWGSVLLFPNVLHWLAERHSGWLISVSLVVGLLFTTAALNEWGRDSSREIKTQLLAWCGGVCLVVAAWGYMRRPR
jgi:hypothetical protein